MRNRAPWVDVELIALMREREATYRRYQRTRHPSLLDEFSRLRIQVETQMESALPRTGVSLDG